jgi:formylglycine-generating enzyme required for sulfatase activity
MCPFTGLAIDFEKNLFDSISKESKGETLPNVLPAPGESHLWPAWRKELIRLRKKLKRKLKYDDSMYDRKSFSWVSSCFSCCFLMLNDERFVDPTVGNYRLEQFLTSEFTKFGGYNAVVLWQAYPRIGLDDRTQFDFYRDMPGGLQGLRDVTKRLHARGIKVFLCYNPWDRGTRKGGENHMETLIDFVDRVEADGIFLDTMNHSATEFREKLDGIRDGIALESEIALPLENVHNHHLSWAQWFKDSEVPGVLRNKWFERRHMQHQIARWNWDHTAELHMAWMNGSGMMVWENVFGQWMGWSERDQSILRSMLPIQRCFADLFSGENWEPLVPSLQDGVYASRWGDKNLRLWTLVNRRTEAVEGELFATKEQIGNKYYDLVNGREIKGSIRADQCILNAHLHPKGIGCFLSCKSDARPVGLEQLLIHQANAIQRYSNNYNSVKLKVVKEPIVITRRVAKIPEGMIKIPGIKGVFQVAFQVREVGFYEGWTERPLTFPWLNEKVTFGKKVSINDFAIDKTPVTNQQFEKFIKSAGYQPKNRDNFLKHWKQGKIPPGEEDHPVVYICLNDAHAYAVWAGKRLPTELEWQHAAQGTDSLLYPWGNLDDPSCRNGGERGRSTSVWSYPKGKSPFGALDMCGNVWELTDSLYTDGRNRFLMLKGGSWYKAKGSIWYFDGGPQENNHMAKMLLFWPGLDRCKTVGFRCVVDL